MKPYAKKCLKHLLQNITVLKSYQLELLRIHTEEHNYTEAILTLGSIQGFDQCIKEIEEQIRTYNPESHKEHTTS